MTQNTITNVLNWLTSPKCDIQIKEKERLINKALDMLILILEK